jgi:hypothetical protein
VDAEAKNLEAISKAIDEHNSSCPWPASEVRMSPFEVERLGWDEIRGLPIVADPAIGTGRFIPGTPGRSAGAEEVALEAPPDAGAEEKVRGVAADQ